MEVQIVLMISPFTQNLILYKYRLRFFDFDSPSLGQASVVQWQLRNHNISILELVW